MAENYKHLYEQTKKMLTMYQDELIPGFRKQIEELELTSKWIPVAERLPGFDTERVLVLMDGNMILGYPKMDTDRYVDGRWVRYGDHVTHWMPLPEPPKEVE